jgi:cytochrome o ubiquinol oxidase operon protein cyoD
MAHHDDMQQDIAFGNDHGTVKSYIIGFMLSLILSIVPFVLVLKKVFVGQQAFLAISALALAQLLVQIYFFLHLNTHSKARWNLNVFLFTLLVVLILVGGSLWIMYNLNYYMVH